MDNRLREDKALNDSQFSSIASILQKMQGDKVNDSAQLTNLCKRFEALEMKNNTLTSHVTQVSNTVSDLQAKNGGGLPSNTVINPKSLNAINLRSGRVVKFSNEDDEEVDEEIECDSPPSTPIKLKHFESTKKKELIDNDAEITQDGARSTDGPGSQVASQPLLEDINEKAPTTHEKSESTMQGALTPKGKEVKISDIPFPNAYFRGKKLHDEQTQKEMIEFFSKLEVNMPFLNMIKSMPAYCKFLKDLCTHKRKFRPNERVQLSSNVSAIFKPQLPIKCQDPGAYTIPCTIGPVNIAAALLDLGAAINVMPKSVYIALGIKAVKPTSVMLQLADRSIRHPDGILEDILVKVKDLVFPADFYVLDVSNELASESTLILGRPFLRTANTIIDMKEGAIPWRLGIIRYALTCMKP
ncbi:uncharacterized protein LOC114732656 [Neltuma alba]|uniref:uncharacterized protein LOC114732656 n=1 Tax=Neltuma alba TaxID=207710 RepID=UPI0010A2C55A|nr:uncharacterized protein LOC114732656 [Prosopis alba]